MATLAAIQKQIADLEKRAEAIRKAEASAAAAKARDLIAKYQLTAEDLGLAKKAGKRAAGQASTAATATTAKRKPAVTKTAGVPKYRDPKSDKTWTGTGKPPGWIAGAKNRSKFLIDPAAAPAKAATPAPTPAAGKAAPRKPRAVKSPTAKPVANLDPLATAPAGELKTNAGRS